MISTSHLTPFGLRRTYLDENGQPVFVVYESPAPSSTDTRAPITSRFNRRLFIEGLLCVSLLIGSWVSYAMAGDPFNR
jgi:hypothetical protein